MRPRSLVLFTLLTFFTGISPVAALQPYSERVHEHLLANGLKVLLLEDHKAPVGVLQLWYRVGSRNERPGFTGLSHVLEHMMFKGTKKYGPEEYSRIIQRNGGNENAFTTEDSTTYFATLASDRLETAIELEADRMHNLAFAEDQFTPELQVILEERRMRVENSPASAMFEGLRSTAYAAHPYQWPVIGWMTDIEQTRRSDALDYYRQYYQPNNAVLIAVGDFESDKLLAVIEKHFGPIPRGPQPPLVRAIEPAQDGERRVVVKRPAELPYVAFAYHVPEIGSDDAYALELAAAVLAGGKSARLYEDLVYKRRLARSAAADYDMLSIDPSLFYLYAQPFPGKKIPELEKALDEHVDRLRRQPVAAEELNRARAGLESGFVLAQDSLFYQAMLLGQYETAGSWRALDEYLPRINAVTPDQIQQAVQYHLRPENRTVGVLDAQPVVGGRPPVSDAPPAGMVR